MSLDLHASLDSEWKVDSSATIFTSTLADSEFSQRLVFNGRFQDGSIEAKITLLQGRPHDGLAEQLEGSLVFRYQDPLNYYFAGLGGFYGKFYIGKMIHGQPIPLKLRGDATSLQKDSPYTVLIRCSGSLIRFYHNGAQQLFARDPSFRSGLFGLSTFKTIARFDAIDVDALRPVCFVIMPFSEELNAIYAIIKETAEKSGYQCRRADERFLSGPIINDVLDQIAKASLIIADFTGKNANVFYEAGYAEALRKPVVQIAQSVEDLPFDVRHLRTFRYDTKILSDRRLRVDLEKAILVSSRESDDDQG